jgi:DNA-binding transcriptional LysR family regulator
LVRRAIRAFREACPTVSLTLEECLSNEPVDRVRNEQMDVAFIRTNLGEGHGLVVNSLLDELMVVALPSTHILAQSKFGTTISLERLARETIILYGPPGTGMYDATIAACQAAGFNPRIGNLGASAQLAPRITSTLSLVGAGLGIRFVRSSLQRVNIEGVTYRSLKGPIRPKATLKLASRRGDQSAVVKQFVSFVRKEAKDFAAK